MLQSMGSQTARHKRVTEQQQLVISAMILFPNKVTCCGIGDTGDQDLNKPLLENPVPRLWAPTLGLALLRSSLSSVRSSRSVVSDSL